MADVEGFQVYLLSKMSALGLVNEALARLGISHDEMHEKAAAIAAKYGLGEIVHPAAAYQELIGPPALERERDNDETEDVFAGSIQRCYALPLWPAVHFVVHEHPTGYAWGFGFEQRKSLPARQDRVDLAERVRPWEFALDALLGAATEVERLDEWTHFLEAILTFSSGDGRKSAWRARFDVGLLQSWESQSSRDSALPTSPA
jgi:hypothetical protein